MTSLEDIFAQIQKGNELASKDDYWRAAQEFSGAQKSLQELSKKQNAADDEHNKIQQLYAQQASEYFEKARETLIRALEYEKKQDELLLSSSDINKPAARFCLTDEQAQQRLLLFASLFAKDEAVLMSGYVQADMKEQQSSLEDRLTQLNQSLPKGFQTSDERMRQINQGLNRLGFSLYSHSDNNNSKIEAPQSEQEQIQEIIAQAKDEMAFTGTSGRAEGTETKEDATTNSVSSSSSSSSLDESNASAESGAIEEEMTPEQISSIRDKVVEAQAHLAQLLVLLEADEGGDAEIEFVQNAGKHALKQARKLLQQADQEWKAKKIRTS